MKWHDGFREDESDSKEYGSLIDCLALCPEQFKDRYAIRPDTYIDEKQVQKDWHHASKTCKKWIADHKGFEIVSDSEFKSAKTAVDRLFRDKIIAEFVEASDRQVWVAAEWFDEVTKFSVPIKCMIDLLPRSDSAFYKSVGDMKTAQNASAQTWSRTVFKWQYHWQAAFNFDMVRAALPSEDRCNFCHIVQESSPPYQTGRRIISDDFLVLGRAEYSRALGNYCWCVKNNKWPDYDDNDESSQGWSITAPEPFMEGAALFGVRFKDQIQDEDAAPAQDPLGDVTP
jgi:hypothetical protein